MVAITVIMRAGEVTVTDKSETPIEHAHFLSDQLGFLTTEARFFVVDALYCQIFNKAGEIEGNTAENDTEWFARQIWQWTGHDRRWSEPEERRYMEIARVAIERLPYLLGRISARLRTTAEALQTMRWAERQISNRKREQNAVNVIVDSINACDDCELGKLCEVHSGLLHQLRWVDGE